MANSMSALQRGKLAIWLSSNSARIVAEKPEKSKSEKALEKEETLAAKTKAKAAEMASWSTGVEPKAKEPAVSATRSSDDDAGDVGVGGDDTKEIVGLPHHAGRLDDRGNRLDRLLKLEHRLPGHRGEGHPHDRLVGAPHRLAVDNSAVAGDHSVGLESADPSEAWRGAESYQVSKIVILHASMALKLADNCAINRIHDIRCYIWVVQSPTRPAAAACRGACWSNVQPFR